MFYYVNGAVAHLEPDKAVIDCAGVGYLVSITKKAYEQLVKDGAIGADGEPTGLIYKMYTYFNVREDAQELYGFCSEKDCSLFKLLISVSGVGPKAALAILSALDGNALIRAVVAGDAKTIATAQGIGLKTAQKIILELKDKLSGFAYDGEEPIQEPVEVADSDVIKEATDALVVLGYTRSEAVKAVRRASGATVEDVIRSALSQLMQ